MGLRNFIFGWQSLGIKQTDVVIEVGSGNRPIARSDVLCDLGPYGEESRYVGSMPHDTVVDRPFVFANAEKLPFQDKAFDFLISAHMLEHIPDPAAFLEEASRISKRGVIITPSPTFEKIFAESTHLWYLSLEDNTLVLRAKEKGDKGCFGKLFQENWESSWHLRQLIWNREDLFETRYFYEDGNINYKVVGSPCSHADDSEEADEMPEASEVQRLSAGIRSYLGKAIRTMASKKQIDLYSYLCCLDCGAKNILRRGDDSVYCGNCNARYPLDAQGAPVMLESHMIPADGIVETASGN